MFLVGRNVQIIMKQTIKYFLLLQLVIVANCYSQKIPRNIPVDVRERLVETKAEIQLALDSCRTTGGEIYCGLLSRRFPDPSLGVT